MVLYFVAFIDRVNIGFAAFTMNKAAGLTPQAFGLGAGIFFLGYFLCEIPSNPILQRVGARRWIARVMLTWSLASGAALYWSYWRLTHSREGKVGGDVPVPPNPPSMMTRGPYK